MDENLNKDVLEERKKKAIDFLKAKTNLVVYSILALIVFLGVFIRTLNISKLKDVTTGSWTLGPDLDPFLFLRWAKYIVEHGKLFVLDAMRSVPLAEFCSGTMCNPINTAGEMRLLPYMMAWFHKFLAFFRMSNDVTYSSILFPVIMFGLTIIAFFLFARKIFYKQNNKIRNIIALIATLFFALIPSLLPRTIAGIPEKESAAFFFMFLAFYLFLEAFTSKKLKRGILFGILSGIATACMALIWGGFIFIFYTIAPTILVAFILGKVKWKELGIFFIWLLSSIIVMTPFSARYSFRALIPSFGATEIASAVILLIGMSLLLMKNKKLIEIRKKTKFPEEIFCLILSVLILFIIGLIVLGPNSIFGQLSSIKSELIEPQTSRFGLTVAENKQPYFTTDWKGNFGPVVFNVPLFFWLFFIGSVTLFNSLIRKMQRKEKIILTFGYFIFLICLIFSRYSPNSVLEGTNFLSHIVYFGGVLFFLGCFGYYYLKRYRENNFSVFREFNFAYILYFMILTLGIIGARGGIRLIMVLGAVSPVAIAFLIVKTSKKYFSTKDDTMKLFVGIVALIIIVASILTLWSYYQIDKVTAENFAPSSYNWQWQNAMAWVRDNTQQNAVFAHWWDYGYWIQSIGERSTILDGGNAIVYWDYLMGRYVLTGTDERETLEFLYTHNTTHLLIDSTDIGKYTAFSSIGSDENYDRFSWISTFLIDEKQTQEAKDETSYIYRGSFVTDEDIVWNQDENKIFIPKKVGGVGAIILKIDSKQEISQPNALFVYNGKQYIIPLRFAYYNGQLQDFGSGLDAGIFIYPELSIDQNNQISVNKIGAMFYLSKKTVHSQLARLYLFDEKTNYFKLVHSEDSYLTNTLKQQGLDLGGFVYYQGFQGPIKIWQISYPSDIKANLDYLKIEYPDDKLWQVKQGEYS